METKTFPANASAVKPPITRSAISTNPSSNKPDAFTWVPFLGFIFVGSLLLFSLIALANSCNRDDDRRRGGGGRHKASSHSSSSYYSGGSTGGSTGGNTGSGFGGGAGGF